MTEGGIAEAAESPPHPRRTGSETGGGAGDERQAVAARSGETGSRVNGVAVDDLWGPCKAQ